MGHGAGLPARGPTTRRPTPPLLPAARSPTLAYSHCPPRESLHIAPQSPPLLLIAWRQPDTSAAHRALNPLRHLEHLTYTCCCPPERTVCGTDWPRQRSDGRVMRAEEESGG